MNFHAVSKLICLFFYHLTTLLILPLSYSSPSPFHTHSFYLVGASVSALVGSPCTSSVDEEREEQSTTMETEMGPSRADADANANADALSEPPREPKITFEKGARNLPSEVEHTERSIYLHIDLATNGIRIVDDRNRPLSELKEIITALTGLTLLDDNNYPPVLCLAAASSKILEFSMGNKEEEVVFTLDNTRLGVRLFRNISIRGSIFHVYCDDNSGDGGDPERLKIECQNKSFRWKALPASNAGRIGKRNQAGEYHTNTILIPY